VNRFGAATGGLVLLTMCAVTARAADDEPPVPPGFAPAAPSIDASLPDAISGRDTRAALRARGIEYRFATMDEVLGVVSGGLRRGAVYQGRFDVRLGLDLETLAGLPGLHFYASMLQTRGNGRPGQDYAGAINTLSTIEALPNTRLSELWFEQQWRGDTISLRAGQMLADNEFAISDVSAVFLSSGWPAIMGANLPSAGPSDPLATPGARLKFAPNERWAFLVAAFDGDPAGPSPGPGLGSSPGEPERRDANGTNFRLSDPPFVIAETQYKYEAGFLPGFLQALPGTLRVGGWHHFGLFKSQRTDTLGLPLAAPTSTGTPQSLRGNGGVYGIVDQEIVRFRPGDKEAGIAVFGRISASPSDRNPVDFSFDGGLVVTGLDARRAADKFGATFQYARLSDGARGFDADAIRLNGLTRNIRDRELAIELTYLLNVVPGWTVQPDVQFVLHPGGQSGPGAPGNVAIFGLRTAITY
jgi:porin